MLKTLTIKTKNVRIKVCPTCWEPDQPQLSLGLYPVNDPQAVREPRPDLSYWQSGLTGLQTDYNSGTLPLQDGFPGGGSEQGADFSQGVGIGRGNGRVLQECNKLGQLNRLYTRDAEQRQVSRRE